MANDIGTYGSPSQGLRFYWVREASWPGGYRVVQVAIDELGNVARTRVPSRPDDPAAWTIEEAIEDRLAPAMKEADRALERRRAQLPEPEPEPEAPPMDPATAKLYDDGEYADADLSGY